jgi:protein MpaA
MDRVRDYRQVVQRLQALRRAGWHTQRVGEVWGYPFFRVQRAGRSGAPTVLLAGGMHGEEPAGVEAVLRWMEQQQAPRWPVNWLVLPCINPYGWERNRRTNAQRRDINRQFRNLSDCPEAELVKQLVGGKRFLVSMEFHEDVGASGYYLYELRAGPPYLGERILAAVRRVVPLNRERVIEGNRVTAPALIRREATRQALRRRRRWPMAFHLFVNCTAHVLGSETAVQSLPVERRARAHTTALAAALEGLARQS